MSKRCRFFHKWEQKGFMPLASLVYECRKCGWWKVWDGFIDVETIYPPERLKEGEAK